MRLIFFQYAKVDNNFVFRLFWFIEGTHYFELHFFYLILINIRKYQP